MDKKPIFEKFASIKALRRVQALNHFEYFKKILTEDFNFSEISIEKGSHPTISTNYGHFKDLNSNLDFFIYGVYAFKKNEELPFHFGGEFSKYLKDELTVKIFIAPITKIENIEKDFKYVGLLYPKFKESLSRFSMLYKAHGFKGDFLTRMFQMDTDGLEQLIVLSSPKTMQLSFEIKQSIELKCEGVREIETNVEPPSDFKQYSDFFEKFDIALAH